MISYRARHPRWMGHYDQESDRTVGLGFLSQEELDAFSVLIKNRRSLPVFLGDCWRCYACTFECSNCEAMAAHIIRAHDPEPVNDEDEQE